VYVLVLLAAVFLSACAPEAGPVRARPDPTAEAWYGETVQRLTVLNSEAENSFRSGNSSQAGAMITQGQPLMNRLLSVPRPTLAAVEAASDLDDLYGRMLLANRHNGWARLLFQKNLARWKNWNPQIEEAVRRRKLAESRIEECDRAMTP